MAMSILENVTSLVVNDTNLMYYMEEEELTYMTIRRIQTVMIPIICVVGIIGNVLAVGAFFSPSLRSISCCLYLGVKCISDIGFLLSLFVVWLYRVHVPIFNINVICQTTIFLSYICAFLSVWFVVILTFENFIRISQPQLVPRLCQPQTAIIVIVTCVTISLCLYNFPIWTAGIVKDQYGASSCSTRVEFQKVTMVLTYIDTILTLVLPFVTMLVLVLLITCAAIRACERKKRLFLNLIRPLSRRPSPETAVTKLLFAVSIVFLVLHTPIHSIRLKLVIMRLLQNALGTYTDMILQRTFEIFYYLDFCLSLAVYLIFGDNFKKVFMNMYFKKCCRRNQNSNTEQILNRIPRGNRVVEV